MKRQFADDSYDYQKKHRGDPRNDFRFLLASRSAGAIIGKGGQNIKSLRTQHSAEITIPDSNTPERVLCIASDLEKVADILADIIPKIDEANQKAKESEIKILVHQSRAGGVIGRGGTKIKEFRENTGTAIKCYPECCPVSQERVIAVSGELMNVLDAVTQILRLCDEIPIKGPIRAYDPEDYDPMMIDEYGGFPPDRNFRGRGAPGRMMMGGGGGGGGGGGMFSGSGLGIARHGAPPIGGFSRFGGGPAAMMMPPPGIGGFGRAMPPMDFYEDEDDGEMTTQKVTIPNDLAGSIIGKGGDRIKRIRDESGAQIVVNPAEEGSTERIIAITASPARIRFAQYLLQQCVRSSAGGRRYMRD